MFFRRRRPRPLSCEERLARLRDAGFDVRPEAPGRVLASRGACAAVLEADPPRMVLTGRWLGAEMARLVDAGYQKFWRTSAGFEAPALAEHLSELHAFQEDLRAALGLTSYYNTSLGTVNHLHLYDRVSPPSASNSR